MTPSRAPRRPRERSRDFEMAVLRWLAGHRKTPPSHWTYGLSPEEGDAIKGQIEVYVREAAHRLGIHAHDQAPYERTAV
jgi:hypothetical protein